MTKCFFEFYRCPSDAVRFDIGVGFPSGPGYFRLGEELTIYGKTAGVPGAKYFSDNLRDVLPAIRVNRGEINLPFDPDRVADILRYERYPMEESNGSPRLGARPWVRDLYYLFRPLMPVPIRRVLQQIYLRRELDNPFPRWPVDRTVDRLFEKLMELALRANGNVPIPFIWFWPEGAQAALILTHDIETAAGVAFCQQLMDMDEEYGFRSAFQVVPEKRYEVTDSFLQGIKTAASK